MTKGWNKYKREVRTFLKCGRKQRKSLLDQLEAFKDSANSGLEENSYDWFAANFGPPEEMAASLMQNISAGEIAQFQNGQRRKRFFLCVFVAAVIAGTLYIWFEKSNPIVVYDDVSAGEEIQINEKENPK